MNKINRCIFCGQFSEQSQSSKKVVFNDVIKTIFDNICLNFRGFKYDLSDVQWVASLMSVNKATLQKVSKILSSINEYYKMEFAFTAMKHGYPLVFRALLDVGPYSGLNPNQILTNSSNKHYRVLTHAVQGGHANIVRMLIQSKAAINFTDRFSDMPELENGNHRNRNNVDLSPFLLAVSQGSIDIVQMLHKAGANIMERTSNGEGALMVAFRMLSSMLREREKYGKVLEALLHMPGCDVNACYKILRK